MPRKPRSSTARTTRPRTPAPIAPPAPGNTQPLPTAGPQFGQPAPTPDPTRFTVMHTSDGPAYKILDSQKRTLQPRPFPIQDSAEPILTLAQALGPKGDAITAAIQQAGQIVFHAVGDTGSTTGPADQSLVADKMVSDYDEANPRNIPSFFYHLGDVIYSFGEAQYYYDQFYDPYRDYPAPIFAIPGNHDGMVSPLTDATSLGAFLTNFCAAGQPPHRTPQSGELGRTAQIQPGVYFTLHAPFLRILGLYSNCLEDPGIISTQGGTYPYLTDTQLTFLQTALTRAKKEKYPGALLIAVHHPPYVAVNPNTRGTSSSSYHGSSPLMLRDIDAACEAAGLWPHAILSGHAHNYQRFTRRKDGRETPFLVAGGGGHHVNALTKRGTLAIRVPVQQDASSDGTDTVTFERYDDQDFGYLRITVDARQLHIEYHPATDGAAAKTADDSVTVDLATRTLAIYQLP